MSTKQLKSPFRDSLVYDWAFGAYVVRRSVMKDILVRLLWEVIDLAQLALKDYLANKEKVMRRNSPTP